MGHFYLTRPNPTHQLTDLTRRPTEKYKLWPVLTRLVVTVQSGDCIHRKSFEPSSVRSLCIFNWDVPVMGKSKSWFDLNHDWITHNDLIWRTMIWFGKRVIWFEFDLKYCDLIWNHSIIRSSRARLLTKTVEALLFKMENKNDSLTETEIQELKTI